MRKVPLVAITVIVIAAFVVVQNDITLTPPPSTKETSAAPQPTAEERFTRLLSNKGWKTIRSIEERKNNTTGKIELRALVGPDGLGCSFMIHHTPGTKEFVLRSIVTGQGEKVWPLEQSINLGPEDVRGLVRANSELRALCA